MKTTLKLIFILFFFIASAVSFLYAQKYELDDDFRELLYGPPPKYLTLPLVKFDNPAIINRIDSLIESRKKRVLDFAYIAVLEDSSIYVTDELSEIDDRFMFKYRGYSVRDRDFIGFLNCKNGCFTIIKNKGIHIPWITFDNTIKRRRKIATSHISDAFYRPDKRLDIKDLLKNPKAD